MRLKAFELIAKNTEITKITISCNVLNWMDDLNKKNLNLNYEKKNVIEDILRGNTTFKDIFLLFNNYTNIDFILLICLINYVLLETSEYVDNI